MWTGQSWLGSPKAAETYAIAAPYTYTPVNAASLINDYGVSPASTYSASYNDYSAPGATTVGNTTSTTFVRAQYLGSLMKGQYSVNPSTGAYNFSPDDAGTTVTMAYSFVLTTINQREADVVPSALTLSVGSAKIDDQYHLSSDLGVTYEGLGANAGTALTRANGTPDAAGTYSVSGSGPATCRFSSADLGAEVTITFQVYDRSAVGQNESTMLDFTTASGTIGQAPYSYLSCSYPGAAIGYSCIAAILYEPMDLGVSGVPQENRFEVITPGIYGGVYADGTPILDCNPLYCMLEVLTNGQWGLGVGAIPFPADFIDATTWGAAGGAGVQNINSTAWNWFASNSFFISPLLDSQDTAASAMSKWLEAGMCAAFVSEGLLKLVPYGDTTQAANGCTWTAPTIYAAALDDTCFIAKDGQDPVMIKRSAWQDAQNVVQVQWDNRGNQYAVEITQESDQSLINRFGSRIENPQSWDFIHTLRAATVAANLRLKRSIYIRNTYEFSLPFAYDYLEPMDLVTLTTSSVWAAGLNNEGLGVTNLPVRITKIVDDPIEGLKLTAEDYPFSSGQATLYTKGLSPGEVVSDTYAYPGSSEVVLFEAAGRLTGFSGNQIWIGACGSSEKYGSTNVYVSQDNVNFVLAETINQTAVISSLASTFASGTDPDTTNSLVVALAENSAALSAGTTAAADNDTQLCYVDGEVISYSAAAITGQNTYTMGGHIRRGQLGTTIGSHTAGSLFMRLDGSVVKYTYDPTWQGKTIYFKFQAVNNFGNNPQPLSGLTAVSFTIGDTNSGAVDAASGEVLAAMSNNIVPNGSFSMGDLRSWYDGGNFTLGSDPTYGLRAHRDVAAGGDGVLCSQFFAVIPGKKYHLTYRVYNSSGSGGIYLRMVWDVTKSTNILPVTGTTASSVPGTMTLLPAHRLTTPPSGQLRQALTMRR
ncbi:MAG: phage tail protein [Edaphobacter sp.]